MQQDGLFNLNSFTQTVGALTVHGGAVTIGGGVLTAAGGVGMTGGTIDSTPTGRLLLGADVTATSSAQGSATISAHAVLTGDRTFTVTPGTAPELTLSGVVGEQGGARALTKAGGGTLLSTADHTYTGLTTVAGGSFVVRGQQPGPVRRRRRWDARRQRRSRRHDCDRHARARARLADGRALVRRGRPARRQPHLRRIPRWRRPPSSRGR